MPFQSFMCMPVDEIEHYCASIITRSAVWEVPPAPPSTRATTPTPDDEPQPFTPDDSVLRAFMRPSNDGFSTSDTSSPCRNTLIFSASEEEHLQDLLVDLKRLPPGSPSSMSSGEGSDSFDTEMALVLWHRAMCKLSQAQESNMHTGSGQSGVDPKTKPYEPLSPISPFIGGRDTANQSFSTSTPRGPKSFNMTDEEMDTSMIMDTTMLLDDSSLDTVNLDASAGAGASATTSVIATAPITRRWSAKIKDKGRAVAQEPNTPPHTPLGVVNGILRARAAHAERMQQRKQEKAARRKEQIDTAVAAAVAEDGGAHARRGLHARAGSGAVGKV